MLGDLPLATRQYVESSINTLSSQVFGDSEISGSLINKVEANHQQVINWLKGTSGNYENNPTPGVDPDTNNGYAWLDKNGKIDIRLMPPIALTNVITIDQFNLLQEVCTLSSYDGETWAAVSGSVMTSTDQYSVVEYWLTLATQTESETEYNHNVQTGDMIIVTFNGDLTDWKDTLDKETFENYIKNWNQSYFNNNSYESDWAEWNNNRTDENWKSFVSKWYKLDNDYVGQYIVTVGNNKNNNNTEDSYTESENIINGKPYTDTPPEVQKLTVPDGIVRSVCNIAPVDDGDIPLQLKELLINDNGDKLGYDRTQYILGMTAGETQLKFLDVNYSHFTASGIAYARFDELSALFDKHNTDVSNINNSINVTSSTLNDRIDSVYNEITGSIDAEVSELNSEIGNIIDIIGKTKDSITSGNYSEAINDSIYPQLRRIYSDLYNVDKNTTITSGKVNFIYNTLNNRAAGIQSLEFDWTANGIITGTFLPENTDVEIECINQDITIDDIINSTLVGRI